MNKKHYVAIAAILKDRCSLHARASQDTVDKIAEDLVEVFENDNDNFDAHRFLQAAGHRNYRKQKQPR